MGAEAQAKGGRLRTGAEALMLLCSPFNGQILKSLDSAPLSLTDLRRAVGWPPQTTMRSHLRLLIKAGILECRRRGGTPGAAEYELLPAGRQLNEVVDALQAWLLASPDGPLEVGSTAGKSSTKALAEGWSSGLVRALAAKPLTLTEVSQLINGLSYHSLDRRLTAMRLAGLIEPAPAPRRGTPYQVTDWLRQGIGPLAAAARWERRNAAERTSPIRPIDVEAAFLLALPLVQVGPEQSGTCRLLVDSPNGGSRRRAGVVVEVDDGRIASCVTRIEAEVDASAVGSAAAWARAVLARDPEGLEFSGRRPLAISLSLGLHSALVG